MTESPFSIKPVDASCANMVPEVFRSIYGDNFPVEYVYHGNQILEEIESGRLNSAIALNTKGIPVGYVAIYINSPNCRLWEGGNLLVVPGCGDGDLARALFRHFLRPENMPESASAGMFVEAVCHHYFTQVGCSKSGFVDCALMLDQTDREDFKEHAPETERGACLLQFYEQSDPISECYLPDHYFDLLQGLLKNLRPRRVRSGSAPLPVEGDTARSDRYFAGAGMCRVSVSSIGSDWGTFLDELLVQARLRQVTSLQLVLSTALPYISAAVEEMRQRRFFLGGIFPRWFGADGIMMQQVLDKRPDYEGIKLYTAGARELLASIREDWKSVQEENKK
ncbi:MAG: hypothetical protein WCG31_07210 [Deltaproteobacteria bacterium]|jgi:hypothetical protein